MTEKKQNPTDTQSAPAYEQPATAQEEIAQYLEKLSFRKKLLGGVDSIDVWKKLKKLDEMYAQAMRDQQPL